MNGIPFLKSDIYKDIRYIILRKRRGGVLSCYVMVPRDHPWYRKRCYDITIELDYPLTFDLPVYGRNEQGNFIEWWVGFDCGVGFNCFPQYNNNGELYWDDRSSRNIEFIIIEGKRLIDELIKIYNK